MIEHKSGAYELGNALLTYTRTDPKGQPTPSGKWFIESENAFNTDNRLVFGVPFNVQELWPQISGKGRLIRTSGPGNVEIEGVGPLTFNQKLPLCKF